jgi:uracil phosphoribosyltransferase
MASLPTNVHVSRHPCLRAKISQLRSKSANARETKQLVHEISLIIGTQALADLETTVIGKVSWSPSSAIADGPQADAVQDESPIGFEYDVESILPEKITLVPILRSGLGMLDGTSTQSPVSAEC